MRRFLPFLASMFLCGLASYGWQPEGWVYIKWNRWYALKENALFAVDFRSRTPDLQEWYYNVGCGLWNDLDLSLFEDAGWVYFTGHFARHPSYGWIYLPYNGHARCWNLRTGERSELGER